MFKKSSLIFSLAIAIVFLAAGSAAFAASPALVAVHHPTPHGAHALMVTLDSVSGTTLTVTARGSSAAITTIDASSAKILVKGASSIASALHVGDRLIVLGTPSGSSSFVATRITDGAGSSVNAGIASGVVTAVSGNTITISTNQRVHGTKGSQASASTVSITVTTDAKTTFNVPGIKSATIANVTIGNRIMVIGVDPATGTGTARLVSVSPAPTHLNK